MPSRLNLIGLNQLDLGAQTVLDTIGEAGRGVVKDSRAVHAGEEALGGAEILRNDHRQRQLRAKLASLAAEKRSVKGADHFRRVTDAEREAAAALPVTV